MLISHTAFDYIISLTVADFSLPHPKINGAEGGCFLDPVGGRERTLQAPPLDLPLSTLVMSEGSSVIVRILQP